MFEAVCYFDRYGSAPSTTDFTAAGRISPLGYGLDAGTFRRDFAQAGSSARRFRACRYGSGNARIGAGGAIAHCSEAGAQLK